MKRLISGMGAAITLLAAACSHQPKETPAPVIAATPPAEEETASIDVTEKVPTERERVQRAIQLLSEGNEAMALIELDAILSANPASSTATKLREQIFTDPVELLGEPNTPHTVEPGETTSSLAQNHLGDALLFYALSRYNDLEAPNRLMAGQTLKIPAGIEKAPVVEAGAAEVADADEADEVMAASSSPEPVKEASAMDEARARSLRLQALEQLNAGNSDRAVALLQRARSLDSNNPNIAADLEKVERIQAALSGTS